MTNLDSVKGGAGGQCKRLSCAPYVQEKLLRGGGGGGGGGGASVRLFKAM